MSKTQRCLARLQRDVDEWVSHTDLLAASDLRALNSAISEIRRFGHVVRCLSYPDGASWYMLVSRAAYRLWAAENFPRLEHETTPRRGRAARSVTMVCALLNKLFANLDDQDITNILKTATAIGADIQRSKGKFVPVLTQHGYEQPA